MKRLRRMISVVALLALALGCRRSGPAVASPRAVAARAAGLRLLSVDVERGRRSEASCFPVAAGRVATCAHVLNGLTLGIVTTDGRKVPVGNDVTRDPAADLA